jgi:basic amino acid/polyamine antiporter, APA family
VSRTLHPLQEVVGRTDPPPGLRRLLGSPALFGIVQGFIAAAIYFGLGLVAERALGYTWLVFVAAAIFFVLLVLSYVEGASLHQERGGATVIARYGFNELVSFIAGWAILLDYVLVVALCAFVAGGYAGVLWEPLGSGTGQVLVAFAVVLTVAALNVRGPGPAAFDRAAFVVLADLLLQVTVIVLGLALVLEPEVLRSPGAVAGTPAGTELVFAFTLAIIAFLGIDASSGLAGQVVIGRMGLRRLISARIVAAVAPLVGLAILAASVLPLAALSPQDVQRPMVAVVEGFEQGWLREPLRVLVALSAFAILLGAALTAMLGLSRLGYSLALNRQIPSRVGRLHPRRSTPVVVIAIATALALALVVPGDLGFLAETYAFGAALAFTLVHASVISLRFREAARDRPYRMPLNVGRVPVPAVLGMVASAAAFVAVVAIGSGARIIGPAWLAAGLVLYLTYRVAAGKPVLGRVSVPERTLTRTGQPTAAYGSILVPILGTPLDGDIMQTAVRLTAEDETDPDLGEGVTIEAVWVHTIPLSLPLDSPVAETEIHRAREALDRAKAVGESYGHVRVLPRRVRGRTPGEAIVREARRKGVEAIVLAAEEPTRMRGGLHLGGKPGLHDTFVGETTRYVIQRAPCRIILTAPPAEEAPEDGAAGGPARDPTRPGTT